MRVQRVPAVSPGRARYALGVLFTINLFNYIDRQVISGVLPLVQQDLGLSDTALGWLASAFMVLYLTGSVPLGILGDRVARHRLIAVGVGIWGAATFLSGLARSYGQLFAARAVVGIGEASYGPTASAMVSDLFPRERRGFVNGLFNAAIPLGGAIGVIAGGLVGSRYGWRAAFLLVGVPSLALSALAWRLGDPLRGGQDTLAAGLAGAAPSGFLDGVIGLFRTPTFVMVCAVGMLVAFAIGAFNYWLPLYLHRVKHFSVPEASFWFGVLSAAGGFLGVVSGGYIGDLLARRTPAGHLLTIAGGFLLAAPAGIVMMLARDRTVFLPALFFAVTFLVLYIGSVNAVIHNVVHPALRATAVAIFVFIVNLGGAALSPAVVGLVSDRRQSLQAAMLMLPILVFFAGLIALAAATVVGADMRRLGTGLGLTPGEGVPNG
ncbi:MAG TPA: MFS transporter [Methylomirabilota bacterium]|nr:MFS transporter [Methylomirabilota bacterium]